MTADICNKLLDLENKIAELNSTLMSEESSISPFSLRFSKKQVSENVNKTKKLQNNVTKLIRRMEQQLENN